MTWVWGDGILHQEENTKAGLVEDTILRTYYHFCLTMKTNGKKKLTPAQ
jgi:hypothetical protein